MITVAKVEDVGNSKLRVSTNMEFASEMERVAAAVLLSVVNAGGSVSRVLKLYKLSETTEPEIVCETAV